MALTEMAIGRGGSHPVPVVYWDTANSLSVTTSGSNAQSAVIDSEKDRVVRVSATQDVWLAFGTNPIAAADTDGSMFLASGAIEIVGIRKGYKIGVIQDSAAGEFSICPAEVK